MDPNNHNSPEAILKRLEELKKWQAQQQKILIQRQNSQRQLLEEEQRLLYEKHGFSNSVSSIGSQLEIDRDGSDVKQSTLKIEKAANIRQMEISSQDNATKDIMCKRVENRKNCENSQVVKRPFLKKGEGLTNRFKVDPEKFRLHNLPKYKFAHRIKHSRPPEKLPKKFTSNGPFREPSSSNKCENNVSSDNNVLCDSENGKYLESSLLNSFRKIPSKAFGDKGDHDAPNLFNSSQHARVSFEISPSNGDNSPDSTLASSWADVLNPNNIKPFSLDNLHKYVEGNSTDFSLPDDELENLSLFELLEKKAREGSILVDSSILQRWLKNVQSPSKDIDQESSAEIFSLKSKRVSPLPFDINNRVHIDDSDASTADNEEEESSNSKLVKYRVRFSDEVEVNEITSESDDGTENSQDESNTSTPNRETNNQVSELNNLSHESTLDNDQSTTLTNNVIDHQQVDLMEKTDRLKTRLVDLEREIADFQKNNVELVKLKQECEIEKIRLDQERQELGEKFKDEQIKLEIQLHDERMKMEEEKKKYEKLVKEHRTKNRKECEDVLKLKEKVEQLQKENREKETKHTAAQARLRAQIRNLEKDLKEFSIEIDVLKKEKKRLENENARLMRNSNNKMLQEINKSIAKLVPKTIPSVVEAKNQHSKPLVAKVTSHTGKICGRRIKKTVISSNASKEKQAQPNNSDDSDTLEENESAYFKNHQRSEEPEDNESEASENEVSQDNAQTDSNPKTSQTQDEFKREILNSDGSKDIWYTNGNLKKISADGMLIRMLYYNKDIKETNINEGTVKYYYAQTNTWHTTYLDGLEILEFPNGQTEHRYKDGTVEVHFENGTIRIANPTDPTKVEEWRYPDGTRLVQLKTGDKILSFPNGQKEVHTKVHKRREYPDGTVKIVYPDGSQETRYSTGRVRLKDKDGNLIMDSQQL